MSFLQKKLRGFAPDPRGEAVRFVVSAVRGGCVPSSVCWKPCCLVCKSMLKPVAPFVAVAIVVEHRHQKHRVHGSPPQSCSCVLYPARERAFVLAGRRTVRGARVTTRKENWRLLCPRRNRIEIPGGTSSMSGFRQSAAQDLHGMSYIIYSETPYNPCIIREVFRIHFWKSKASLLLSCRVNLSCP